MSRLLNCCGRRKKTLLDLKDSMLGPFMLLALRGESSFIQVSGFVVLDRSKALISGCLKIILIRFPRPSGTVAGTGKKNSPIADRRVPSNDSRNNRITQDCSCLLVSSVMNYQYSTAKMISRSFLCYLSHLKPSKSFNHKRQCYVLLTLTSIKKSVLLCKCWLTGLIQELKNKEVQPVIHKEGLFRVSANQLSTVTYSPVSLQLLFT